MKILKWLFGFSSKYRKQEENYENNTKGVGPLFNFIKLIVLTAIPLLALWGAFKLGWDDEIWAVKLLLWVLAFGAIFKFPSEIMILGIVAVRHGIRTIVENKTDAIIDKSMEKLDNEDIDVLNLKKHRRKRYHPVWDFIIGILGILLSIVVVVAFCILFFLFLSGTI